MKPTTVAELRAAIERECTQILRGLSLSCVRLIALCCQQCLDKMDVNLRTVGGKTIK